MDLEKILTHEIILFDSIVSQFHDNISENENMSVIEYDTRNGITYKFEYDGYIIFLKTFMNFELGKLESCYVNSLINNDFFLIGIYNQYYLNYKLHRIKYDKCDFFNLLINGDIRNIDYEFYKMFINTMEIRNNTQKNHISIQVTKK